MSTAADSLTAPLACARPTDPASRPVKPGRATLRVRRVRPESEFRFHSVGLARAMNGPPPRFSACPRAQSFARKFLSELSTNERNRSRSGYASFSPVFFPGGEESLSKIERIIRAVALAADKSVNGRPISTTEFLEDTSSIAIRPRAAQSYRLHQKLS